jgi:hypothetical protein
MHFIQNVILAEMDFITIKKLLPVFNATLIVKLVQMKILVTLVR